MPSNTTIRPWSFLKTLLLSYSITVILLVCFAFLMYQMKLGAAQAAWGVMVIYLIACAAGGFLTGKRMGSRRLFWGLVSGTLYFVVLLLLSLIVGGGLQGELKDVLSVFAACLAGSAVGAAIS